MRIGEVAKRAGIGIETIRFYEREGLFGRTGAAVVGLSAV